MCASCAPPPSVTKVERTKAVEKRAKANARRGARPRMVQTGPQTAQYQYLTAVCEKKSPGARVGKRVNVLRPASHYRQFNPFPARVLYLYTESIGESDR